MSEPEKRIKSKRILVALDTSARGQAALQAAVQLATSISAEVQGLFVEDEDLVRLASLPFAREIDVVSALARPMVVADVEREIRSVAQQTQQAFVAALQQLNLVWTFRTVRGTLAQASWTAAGNADLLVIGQRGRSSRMLSGGARSQKSSRQNNVVAVFDGSPSAFRAIELGNTLAQLNATTLVVLVLVNEGSEQAEQCRTWLKQNAIPAEVSQSRTDAEHGVIDYVRKFPPGLLLINRDSPHLNEKQLSDIVNQFDCPVVFC